MKKLFFYFFLFFFITPVLAQELDFEIEEETEEDSQTPFFDFFAENISGSVVGFESFGAYGSRSNYSLQLQYNKEFGNWGKFVLNANGYYNKVVLKLKLREDLRDNAFYSNRDDYPLEQTLSETNIGGNLREAYFDLNLGNFATLSFGNKLVVFGQFELFSPIDLFSLPSRFGSDEIGFSKLSNRLTQQTVQISLYPIEGIEIEAYQFPKIALDPFVEDALNQFTRETYERCPSDETCISVHPTERFRDSKVYNATIDSNPLTDEEQQAMRILFLS